MRNPDVWENHPVDFTRRLRAEGLPVNPRPIANLEVVEFAVVRRPPKGVELAGFERTDDGWLGDGNVGESKATVGSLGQPVGKQPGFHGVKVEGNGDELRWARI